MVMRATSVSLAVPRRLLPSTKAAITAARRSVSNLFILDIMLADRDRRGHSFKL